MSINKADVIHKGVYAKFISHIITKLEVYPNFCSVMNKLDENGQTEVNEDE